VSLTTKTIAELRDGFRGGEIRARAKMIGSDRATPCPS